MSHPQYELLYAAHTPHTGLSIRRGTHNQAAIRAAGALIWRKAAEGIELLIIHRPRYGDWSWPKGKQDPGETLPETAQREIREEVGLDVTLGAPLAVTAYQVKGRSKEVFYWAAELPLGARPQADLGEVDELRWVSPKQAARMLTNATDRQPLTALMDLHDRGLLRTSPLLFIRHAKAKPRSTWVGAEGERTLAATGKRQALAVGRLMEAWAPERLISSPWVRCLQTLDPYAKGRGISIKEKRALTEDHNARSPQATAKVIEALFDKKEKSLALCTHRPVLATVLKVLRGNLSKDLSKHLPSEDPYLKPGEMWVLQVSCQEPRTVVSLEQVKPFDD